MSDMVFVLGAGGHGKVVADILLAQGVRLGGFLDDNKAVGTPVLGATVVGDLAWLEAHRGARVALGIGDNATRERMALRAKSAGGEIVSAIHPSAVIAASARIGVGTVVMALAVVNADAQIGEGAILNTASVIEHDCRIGAFAHVSPNAAMGGGCIVGLRAHLGIGATMLPGLELGDDAIAGGGAVVTRNVATRAIVAGVPARVRSTR